MANEKYRPLYMIGIAAQLAGMHPQTLRIYESKKLINPERTAKNTRLYSDEDIKRLKYIQRLTQEMGVNLAGVKMIIDLEDEITHVQEELDMAEKEMEYFRKKMEEKIRQIHQSYKKEIMLYMPPQIEIKED